MLSVRAVSSIIKEKVFGGNDQFINPLNYPAAPYWVMFAYKQLAGSGILAGAFLYETTLTIVASVLQCCSC